MKWKGETLFERLVNMQYRLTTLAEKVALRVLYTYAKETVGGAGVRYVAHYATDYDNWPSYTIYMEDNKDTDAFTERLVSNMEAGHRQRFINGVRNAYGDASIEWDGLKITFQIVDPETFLSMVAVEYGKHTNVKYVMVCNNCGHEHPSSYTPYWCNKCKGGEYSNGTKLIPKEVK